MYDDHVREWRRHWLVTLTFAIPGAWPRTETREVIAHTPAELRQIVEWARRTRRVLACRYKPRRELAGDPPSHCPDGHAYHVEGQPYPRYRLDWLACDCGGHVVYICGRYDQHGLCQAEQIEPLLTIECSVEWPPPIDPPVRLGAEMAGVDGAGSVE
jgi:hypothetical protein